MTRKVLVVDDDAAVREALAQTLELADVSVQLCSSFIEAKDHIGRDFDGVILSDIRMPGRDGFYLLGYTLDLDPDLPVILLTGEGDIPMAVQAMSEGAFGFLEKPCASAQLIAVLERALSARDMVLENRRLKEQLETGDLAARLIFGISEKVQALRARMRVAAASGAEVLVTGPAGSGIAKVAEVIHLLSPHAQGPFLKRTAAGLSEAQLKDLGDAARGGALYLDEIGALPQATQYATLELLDQGGGPRLLGGTTTDLEAEVRAGNFNADLFYRLDVMRVRIPALSERPEDIPVLFRHYVAQAAEQAGIAAPDIPSDLQARLMSQDWPGNARALMSAAMRFVLGLPEEHSGLVGAAGLGLSEQMAQVERSLLMAALERHEGHATDVAKALKLPRKTLYDKLTRYGLKPEAFRR